MTGYTYIATPYTDRDSEVEGQRYRAVRHFVAEYARRGRIVYSPILHFHDAACEYGLPTAAAFWKEHNATMLRHAERLLVYKLPGWDRSVGVAYELDLAQRLHIPIDYIDCLPGWEEEAGVENGSRL
jgi:hypothetical protein